MKTFLKFAVLIAVVVLALLTACSNIVDPNDPIGGNRYTAESDFSFTIGVTDKSKLDLTSINGDIEIYGVDAVSNVIVSGTKICKSDNQMDAENYLQYLKVSISESGNTLFVESEQPKDTDGRSVSISYHILVPKAWATTVELTNGGCFLDSLQGNMNVQLVNGNIALGDVFASAWLRVTNGQIDGNVNLPQFGVLNAQTTNGVIAFGVPKTTSAQLTAQVVNGTVNVSGLVLDNMVSNQKQVRGTLGLGEGRIELQTTNGNISVVGF